MLFIAIDPAPIVLSAEHRETPTCLQLDQIATELAQPYAHHRLHLKDIPKMMRHALTRVAAFNTLLAEEQIEAAMYVIDQVLDKTESTKHLDLITDPLYKALARPFCRVLLYERINPFPEPLPSTGVPTEELMQAWEENILSDFKGGLHLKDLAILTHKAIYFARQFGHLNCRDKVDLTKGLIEKILDETPHRFVSSHAIFKDFIIPIVQLIFEL